MRKFFAKGKVCHYFIIIFILLLAVLAFYLSCRSKSPTEADSKLNNQVTAQSTNNTTTSSSTTTSVKPGQSPTNTTTLITSRNLTTTSTRTTTSSSSTTSTTTSRKPTTSTTSTTTTSIPVPILEWCSLYVGKMSGGSSIVVNQQDQVVSLALRDQGIVICQFEMKNIGTAPTTNLTISINQIAENTSHLNIQSSWAVFSSINQIPNTGNCTLATAWPCIIILLSGATSGEEFTITLIENVTQKTFSFKLHVT